MNNDEKLCPYCLSPNAKGSCKACGKRYKASDFPSSRLAPFTLLKRRYLIGGAIGEGGFGVTYLGKDTMNGVRVAVKEYYPSSLVGRNGLNLVPKSHDAALKFLQGKKRFTSEAKSMIEVRDLSGITGVLDFFGENNTVYIVMEYLDGVTLDKYFDAVGKLGFASAFRLLKPVLDALDGIHEAGFVHGDISPDNIMIMRSGECKLIDFGAAVHADVFGGSRTVTLKKRYAPPEQYNAGMVLGRAADVYAAGVTLYYAVTHTLPPESTDRLVRDEIKWPSELGARITREEENALATALDPNKDGRFADVRAMTVALDDAVNRDPNADNEKPVGKRTLNKLFGKKK